MRLSGLVVTRNHLSLDYMPVEAALSLVPACDEVVISDMESDDGSWEELQEIFGSNDKFILRQQPWNHPHNDPKWWVSALNFARLNLNPEDWFMQLDADEILGPESCANIRLAMDDNTPGLFRRYTFWRDAQHLVPYNKCCGELVARLGPATLYLPSDEPIPAQRPNIRDEAVLHAGFHIYHYGMIRSPEAFVRKSKVVQNCFFGAVDPRIASAQQKYTKWHDHDFFEGDPLRDFKGKHPDVAAKWLINRGYHV